MFNKLKKTLNNSLGDSMHDKGLDPTWDSTDSSLFKVSNRESVDNFSSVNNSIHENIHSFTHTKRLSTNFFEIDQNVPHKYELSNYDVLNNVCLCMIDIMGFSAWCSNHIPSIIAKTMIEYNNLIGDLLENYPTLKKIELVGDCCMVVGCYSKDVNANDTNCFTCIKFAIDLLSHIDTIKMMFRSKYVGLRIGIHLSDVIGLYLDNPKKYQMYGNDINVCSRLESSTNPNTIHISEKTLMCVKDIEEQELPKNLCVKGYSHKMEHKGVGVITSYIFHLKRDKVLFHNFTIKTANYFSDIFHIDHYTHESDMQVANTLYKSFKYLCVLICLFDFNDQYNVIQDVADLYDVKRNIPCVAQNVIVLCKSESMVKEIEERYPYHFDHVIVHHEHAQISKLLSDYSENKNTFRERGKSFDL